MGQTYRHLIQIQQSDPQKNRHAKMLSMAGHTDFSPNAESHCL